MSSISPARPCPGAATSASRDAPPQGESDGMMKRYMTHMS